MHQRLGDDPPGVGSIPDIYADSRVPTDAYLIGDVAEQMTPLALSQGVDLVVEVARAPLTFVCDPELLRRVLQNLTDNALRFTPEQDQVAFAAGAADINHADD